MTDKAGTGRVPVKLEIPEGFSNFPRYFNRCLTPEEIYRLYKYGATPIEFWSFTARYNLVKGLRLI